MPQLPTHNSKANITANPAAPLRQEAAIPFQQDREVLQAVATVAQRWSDANDVMQYSEAKARHGSAVADIEARAAADPDFKKSDAYIKELTELQSKSTEGISNQQIASRASLEFMSDATIAGINIKTNFQHKQLEANKIVVKEDLDNMMRNKLGAATPALAAQYDQKMQSFLVAHVKTGTLTPEEAARLLKDSQETSVKYEVYADNSTHEKDSTLLKELKNPKGRFGFLDPDTRLQMIEESQRRIFQNNQTMKKESESARDQRFNDIFTKSNEGTLSLSDLDAEMKIPESAGGIPKKQLLDIREGIQKRIESDLAAIIDNDERADKYLTFVDNFISDETDRQKGREAIVNAFKFNGLSSKEAAYLNKLQRETEAIQKIENREEFMGNGWVPFKNAINAINDRFTGMKNFTKADHALAIKTLLNNAADGGDLPTLSQQIIKENVLKKNPNILNFSEEGTLVVDDNGYLRIMNNKGDVKDPKIKAPAKDTPSKEKK